MSGGVIRAIALAAIAVSVSGCLHGGMGTLAGMNMLSALLGGGSDDAVPNQQASSTTYISNTTYVSNTYVSSGSSSRPSRSGHSSRHHSH